MLTILVVNMYIDNRVKYNMYTYTYSHTMREYSLSDQ